jgi:hypothetical protein
MRVLPSTSLTQTFVISTDGCPNSWSNYKFSGGSDCSQSRGGLYTPTESQNKDAATALASGANSSEHQAFKNYGFTNITMSSWADDLILRGKQSVDMKAKNVTVGMISDANFTWVGMRGLAPSQPDKWVKAQSSPLKETKTLIQTLKDANDIPSASWAYHAGSHFGMHKKHSNRLTKLIIYS